MKIPELRNEAFFIPHIVIEIPGLPEGEISGSPLAGFPGLNGDPALQDLYGSGQHLTIWLADQKMGVFRHHDIAIDPHLESAAHLFKRCEECVLHMQLGQKRKAMKATESEKVRLPGVMKPLEPVWHRSPSLSREMFEQW
jgi:hypothetical protein